MFRLLGPYLGMAFAGYTVPAPTPAGSTAPLGGPTEEDQQLIQDFIAISQSASAETTSAIPLAEEVWLGVGDRLHEARSA